MACQWGKASLAEFSPGAANASAAATPPDHLASITG